MRFYGHDIRREQQTGGVDPSQSKAFNSDPKEKGKENTVSLERAAEVNATLGHLVKKLRIDAEDALENEFSLYNQLATSMS